MLLIIHVSDIRADQFYLDKQLDFIYSLLPVLPVYSFSLPTPSTMTRLFDPVLVSFTPTALHAQIQLYRFQKRPGI